MFLFFESVGMLAIDQGNFICGVRLLGAWETFRVPIFLLDFVPYMVREREAHLAAACQRLGEEAFNQAWEKGKAISLEEAIRYVHEVCEA